MVKKLVLTFLGFILVGLCACGGSNTVSQSSPSSSSRPDTTTPTLPTHDPSGMEITVPDKIDSIVVLAPSLAEIVIDLGLADKIVGYDLQSVGIPGLPTDVPTFDILNPDVEQIVALDPDVVFMTNLSLRDQASPYKPFDDAGISLMSVPTGSSIDEVKSDIRFVATVLRCSDAGERLISSMETTMQAIADVAATIPESERKSVYFEISAAPYMYSTGGNTYLNELIEAVGGRNILADQEGWISVEGEWIVEANPDVIFTNVNYIDDPVGEILGRDGWSGISAVTQGNVFYIDNRASSLPNENLVKAMKAMAQLLYPDYFMNA